MKRLPIGRRHLLGELGLDPVDGRSALGMTTAPERSDNGVHGTTIVGRRHPLDEPVAFEAVGELGDVAAHAVQRARERAQARRRIRLHEHVECLELRDGEAHLAERIFEAALDAPRGVEQDEHRFGHSLFGPRCWRAFGSVH